MAEELDQPPLKDVYRKLITDGETSPVFRKYSFTSFRDRMLSNPDASGEVADFLIQRGIIKDREEWKHDWLEPSVPKAPKPVAQQAPSRPVQVPPLLQPAQPAQGPSLTQVTGQQAMMPMAPKPRFQSLQQGPSLTDVTRQQVIAGVKATQANRPLPKTIELTGEPQTGEMHAEVVNGKLFYMPQGMTAGGEEYENDGTDVNEDPTGQYQSTGVLMSDKGVDLNQSLRDLVTSIPKEKRGQALDSAQQKRNEDRGKLDKAKDYAGVALEGAKRVFGILWEGVKNTGMMLSAGAPTPQLDDNITADRRKTVEEADLAMVENVKAISDAFQQKAIEYNIETSVLNALDNGNYWRIPEAAAYTVGDMAMQIIPAFFTGGTSIYFQTIPDTYTAGVEQIAKEKGITVEEVIKSGQDAKLIAMSSAGLQALMERIGITRMSNAFATKGGYKAIRDWMLKLSKNPTLARLAGVVYTGASGAATEMGQQMTTVTGGILAKSKDFVDFTKKFSEDFWTPENQRNYAENAIAGLLGEGGMVTIGRTYNQARNNFERPVIGQAPKEGGFDAVIVADRINNKKDVDIRDALNAESYLESEIAKRGDKASKDLLEHKETISNYIDSHPMVSQRATTPTNPVPPPPESAPTGASPTSGVPVDKEETELKLAENQAAPAAQQANQAAPLPAVEEVTTQQTQPAPQQLTIEQFANPDEFYRVVVGDEAFNDIVQNGVVRTNADNKGTQSGGINLGNRPTAFPSFSRGKASMDYAASNPNNYIIVSSDQSIQPSTKGRHGKGSTMFPTDENGNPMRELDGKKVKVYKHLGNGQYQLVYENGQVVNQQQSNAAPAAATPTTLDTKNIQVNGIVNGHERIFGEDGVGDVREKLPPENNGTLVLTGKDGNKYVVAYSRVGIDGDNIFETGVSTPRPGHVNVSVKISDNATEQEIAAATAQAEGGLKEILPTIQGGVINPRTIRDVLSNENIPLSPAAAAPVTEATTETVAAESGRPVVEGENDQVVGEEKLSDVSIGKNGKYDENSILRYFADAFYTKRNGFNEFTKDELNGLTDKTKQYLIRVYNQLKNSFPDFHVTNGKEGYNKTLIDTDEKRIQFARAFLSFDPRREGSDNKINKIEYPSKEVLKNLDEVFGVESANYNAEQPQSPAQQVADLRAKEQAEYDAMPDPNDEAKRKEIYDRYDGLISPLLGEKAPKAKIVSSSIDNLSNQEKEQLIELLRNPLFDLVRGTELYNKYKGETIPYGYSESSWNLLISGINESKLDLNKILLGYKKRLLEEEATPIRKTSIDKKTGLPKGFNPSTGQFEGGFGEASEKENSITKSKQKIAVLEKFIKEASTPKAEAPKAGSLRDVELTMRQPEKNEVIFVPIDALLEKQAADQPSYDIQKEGNRIKGRVEKAKEFLKNYLKDQRAINPKTGKRTNAKVSFEPSVVDIDADGKISFEDGRHRVLAAKELGLTEVPIEVPKGKGKAIQESLKQQQTNDNKNKQGVSGEVGVGQESVQAQPVEGGGTTKTQAGGNVQGNEKKVSPLTAFQTKGEAGRKAREALKEEVGPEEFRRMDNIHRNGEKMLRALEGKGILEIRCP